MATTAVTITRQHNHFHNSVANGELNQVQNLISNGCDPNIPHSTTGLLPLHFAASRGHVNLVHFLIESCRVNIDAVDKEGETALLKAAYAGHESVIQYLITWKANHLVQDRDGWTALHNACSFGNLAIVEYLVELPNVNVNIPSTQGHTPLMNAASKGYIDIVKYLLAYGSNPLLKNKFGETAYDVAAAAGEAYLCQVIIQHYPLLTEELDTHVTIPVLLVEEQQITNSYYYLKKYTMSESTWLFQGQPVLNKSKVSLPKNNTNWFWLSDWRVDYTQPIIQDNEGWSYTQNEVDWYDSLPLSSCIKRRRQWMRIMKKRVIVEEGGSYSGGGDSSSSSSSSDSSSTISSDEEEEQEIHHQTQYRNKKTPSSVSTTMTKAQSIFITTPSTHQPALPLLLSKEPPPQQQQRWERNDQAFDCRRCHKSFNFIVRKHHCRKCGQVICNTCSMHRMYLSPTEIIQPPNKNYGEILTLQPQRICDQCIVHHEDDGDNNNNNNRMYECPVCTKTLNEFNTIQEQEHVQACLTSNNSCSVVGIRFVVYKLTGNSTLIGQECVICFEEFQSDDTITRLNCMCSYHRHCIHHWFSKGKECPIHSQ